MTVLPVYMPVEGIGPFVVGGTVEPLRVGDPRQVGAYRLLGRLGAGGMGEVFLGESPGGRKVAVKLVLSQHAADREFRQRFAREVTAARQVGGFHTAPVVDADPDADPPWMVTAYIPGPSLDTAVRQNGPLEPEAVRRLGAALAEGLAAVHACGLVHRDLKPSNIILAEDGPRIIDFGIARPANATALTSSGMVIGTFSFMSPEQVGGEHVDSRSDIFALGGVLAYATTGRGPFDAATIPAIMHRITSQPPDLQGVSGPLREIIGACLAKDPADRPSLTGLMAFLSGTAQPGVVADGEAAARPPTEPAPARAPVSEPRTATVSGRRMPGRPPVPVQRPSAQPGPQPRRPARPWKTRVPLITIASLAGVTAVALAISFIGNGPGRNQPSAAATNSSHPRTSSAPSATGPPAVAASGSSFLACMVTDSGGINDKSFNASAWQGMQEAATANPKISARYLQSTSQGDYVPNINTFLGEKCGIIVTVGLLMSQATQTAAQKNPGDRFAIVDNAYTPPIKNVDALLFDTVQDGFLGGYLAAGMTKTGKVATFGAVELPTVTIYMDGFWDGVQYYNSKHGTHVQVLGWNEQTQKGAFTGDFTNQTKGQTVTQMFIGEGADIIFPVAGNVGLGAAKAVHDADSSGGNVAMLWTDTDGCVSVAQYCQYFISSVTKDIQTAVKDAVLSAQAGTFKGGNFIGTLSNGSVGLAPFHDYASKVPAALQAELKTIQTGIENGSIPTPTKSPVG